MTDQPVSSELIPPSRFWPGFALGFFVLAFLSCGGLFMLTGLNRLSLAELQPGRPAWTPAPATATAVVAEVAGSSVEDDLSVNSMFSVGQTVRNITNSRVNVRREPGYLSKPRDDVLVQLQPGDAVVVFDGPVPADNLLWWRVRMAGDAGVTEGWVAEATASGVTILGQ